jgi:hypothetical protein
MAYSHAEAVQGYLAHKNPPPLRTYRRPMPRVLGGSLGVGRFLIVEVPLYSDTEAAVAPPPARGITLIRRHPPPIGPP